MIHTTAIIHPKARIGNDCEVGPYCVIDEMVTLGDNCWLGPYVHLTGVTTVGRANRFHTGVVIGDLPQDVRFRGERTGVIIGDDNEFREHVTIHCSNKVSEPTAIGSHNFLMANSHVGHNTVVGNHVIIANGALLGGHVTVDDRVFISGNCLVHQFVRIGSVALMQGGSAISKDLPPYTISRGDNSISGLNIVGLRRAGMSASERLELKKLYHFLFRGGKNLRHAVDEAVCQFSSPASSNMLNFIKASKRGVLTPRDRSCGRQEDLSE